MYRTRLPAGHLVAVLAVVCGLLAAPPARADTPWWEPVGRPAPDVSVNVTGAPFRGAGNGVRGFADVHNHVMSNLGFGGRLVCGKPYSEQGVADALADCPEHRPDGAGALFENLTADGDWQHDPTGWPTFTDWPTPLTTTHQQNYYAWLERSWRAGQRVLVTDMVSNAVICTILPAKDRGCDEMTAIRAQITATYDLQDYIDRMFGGPGKGWFRIVTDAGAARQVIEDGKLAVVLGVETSEPFGCRQVLDVPQCSQADIDRGLDELHALGVRSMYLCHKFDNALCGVRFDEGTTGTLINAGQFISTGTWWQTEQCRGDAADNPITTVALPDVVRDKLPAGTEVPTYADGAQCNTRGLTQLGESAVRAMMQRGMMIEVDHMSARAADRTLDILAEHGYPGVVSSHSWMDLAYAERLYTLGGFLAVYDHDSAEFLAAARRTAALRNRFGTGLGIGSDYNGVGAHPVAPGPESPSALTYPFRTLDGGAVVDRQQSGSRTFDFTRDGAAHVGMLPDWLEDVRLRGGEDVITDVQRGAESYLDTWSATQEFGSGG
ncbi:membrane dipeptidase [Nocardia lijiangensis]|uniref:membrane dipeptidase n=1 Tax=Nocardia lijiangensis TaxID=299618 RepID=UPI000B0DE9F7|nr:membrane dipeptidase [Nocardia lijiangensis]